MTPNTLIGRTESDPGETKARQALADYDAEVARRGAAKVPPPHASHLRNVLDLLDEARALASGAHLSRAGRG